MSYHLNAYLAKQEVFNKHHIPCRVLEQGIAIATREKLDLAQLTKNGEMIAHVVAEYFGGAGEQSCLVYQNGEVILDMDEWRDGYIYKYGVINTALKKLGVVAAHDQHKDEFDTIRLGRERDNEWLPSELDQYYY